MSIQMRFFVVFYVFFLRCVDLLLDVLLGSSGTIYRELAIRSPHVHLGEGGRWLAPYFFVLVKKFRAYVGEKVW